MNKIKNNDMIEKQDLITLTMWICIYRRRAVGKIEIGIGNCKRGMEINFIDLIQQEYIMI